MSAVTIVPASKAQSAALATSATSTASAAQPTSSNQQPASVHDAANQAAINTGIRNTAKSAKDSLGPASGDPARLSPPKPTPVPAKETPAQQKARESADAARVRTYQQAVEAEQHAKARRAQQEQEARQHGKPTPAAGPTPTPARGASDTSASPGGQTGASGQGQASPAVRGPVKTATPAVSSQGASPAWPAGSTAARSSLPHRSLDQPDLPAKEVKVYINDSVDRNWEAIQSAFNFSNDAKGKNDAKAFLLGVASRESGTGETMRTNLVTGSGASYSKGPLQTADTAYANNGHPEWDKDTHVPGIR